MKHLNTYRSKRRGVTIELALVVMMLVFALGTILVSTALIQNSHKNNRDAEFTIRADLDNITNDFLKTVREDLYTITESGGNEYYGLYMWKLGLPDKYEKYSIVVNGVNTQDNSFNDGDIVKDLDFIYIETEGAEPQNVKADAFRLITLTVSDDATDELLLTIELTLDQEKSTVKPAPQEPAAQARDGETVDQNQNQNDPATIYVIADSVYIVTRWTYH